MVATLLQTLLALLSEGSVKADPHPQGNKEREQGGRILGVGRSRKGGKRRTVREWKGKSRKGKGEGGWTEREDGRGTGHWEGPEGKKTKGEESRE